MPPAGIMSRFLPELFLRGAETDISTVSRLQAEWKLLPPGIQDFFIQDPPADIAAPTLVSNCFKRFRVEGETQSLNFAFNVEEGSAGIHNQGLQELEWSLCRELEKVNIVRERGWQPIPIYHTSAIWPLSTNKGSDVWGPVCSGYNPTICSLTWTL